jgi:tetratricopeptide (TPR) repeat protein
MMFLAIVVWPRAHAGAQTFPMGVVSHWQYYNNAGWVAFQNHDLATAEKKYTAAINILRPYEKIDQRLLARTYHDLARVLIARNRYADAEQLAKWSLHIQESDRRTKPEAIFQNVLLLAQIARERHHDKEADSLFKRVLALQIQALGPEHYQIALTLDDLAAIAVNLGDYPEADTLYRRAVAIHEKINPLENLALAETLEHYATFLRRVNRAADGASQEFRARTIRNLHATRRAGAEAKGRVQGADGIR